MTDPFQPMEFTPDLVAKGKFERAVRNSSKSRDIVLDPFGGSGSTLITCEKAGRRAFLMELDPRYVDVIVSRWEAYTGVAATCTNVRAS